MNAPDVWIERIHQLRDQGMKRRDLSLSLDSINKSTTAENTKIRIWISEYIHEALEKLSTDELEKIRLKLFQVYGIELDTDSWLVWWLVNAVIGNILLPDYFSENEDKEAYKKNIGSILSRALFKIDTILLREQKSPFVLYIWDKKNIDQEIDEDGEFWGRLFPIWVGFGSNIIGYNQKYKRFAFDIPVRIAIPSKLNGEIKEVDPKKIQKMLEEHFGKTGKTPKNRKWKWFQINNRIHTDSETSYGRIEKARYLIISITHESIETLDEDMMSHEKIVTALQEFIEVNNFLIAESAKIIGWNWKTKRSAIITDSTIYCASGVEDNNEIDDEVRTKFGKLMVHMKEPVTLDDIGWQEWAKQEIKKLIAIITNKEIAESWWAASPTWIIFYGPSWTGKTLLWRAIAASVNADVYAIKMTDLANTAYINEWAKNVQDLFKYLRNQASKSPEKKLIIIFDELDALFKSRNSNRASDEDWKIVNTFLTEIDGFDNLKNVIIVGTTNRLESIDSAIKRPGRLGTHIKVDLPTREEREAVFYIHTKVAQKKAKKSDIFNLSPEDYRVSAELSEWLSPADIFEIIRLSVEKRFYDEVQKKVSSDSKITITDIKFSIDKLRHQNGNKNHIFRDLSIPGLNTLIEWDKSWSVSEALRRVIIEKLASQMLEKTESWAVSLPDLMMALEGNKKSWTMGFVPETPKSKFIEPKG